jgi:hypothetical protein
MADGLSINVLTGEKTARPLTRDEIDRRALLRDKQAEIDQQEAARQMQRQIDLEALKTAEPALIGRIVARLLDA